MTIQVGHALVRELQGRRTVEFHGCGREGCDCSKQAMLDGLRVAELLPADSHDEHLPALRDWGCP